MIFKVINDENKRAVATDLTIDVARKIARSYNTKHKTDIFMISSQFDPPHRNGEEISEVIKREIKEFLDKMMKKYPNDATLGAEIRKYNKQ